MRFARTRPVLAVLLALASSAAWGTEVAPGRAAFATMLRTEALKSGLPFDIADAVMAIESGYDPRKIGGVGEIGLMQVRPGTAAMLGFRGGLPALAEPATNIHYGVTYLAEAWRQAGGDLCRALMKYRAGHGETVMTPLSVTYCDRARAHLASIGSPFASAPGAVVTPGWSSAPVTTARLGLPAKPNARRLRGDAFWAAHEAWVRAVSARIERRWRAMASR